MVQLNLQKGGVKNVFYSLKPVSHSHTALAFKMKSHLDTVVSSNGDGMASSCWLPLVPNTTTASGYKSRRRNAGIKGLEVSFDLLCYMCGIEYEAVEDGGVVLFGHSCVVYPVRATDESLE